MSRFSRIDGESPAQKVESLRNSLENVAKRNAPEVKVQTTVDNGRPQQLREQGNLVAFKLKMQFKQTCCENPPQPTGGTTLTTAEGTPATNGPANPASSNPEEVANAIKKQQDPHAQAHIYANYVKNNQNDADKLQQFYGSLGADKTAELTTRAVNRGNPEDVQAIKQSFVTLQSKGKLNQSDMDAFVKGLGKADEIGYGPHVDGVVNITKQVFGALGNDASGQALKNSFAIATARVSSSSDGAVSDRMKNYLAAAGTEILATTPVDNQVSVLNAMKNEGTLQKFIGKAMAGTIFEGHTQDNGVGVLVGAADSKVIFGNVMGVFNNMLNSPKASSELRATMFNGAVQALANDANNDFKFWFEGRTDFKDTLAKIYQKDFRAIINLGVGSNGALDHDFAKGLAKFYQTTMFMPPLGGEANNLFKFVKDYFTNMGNALNDPNLKQGTEAYEKFKRDYGRAPEDYAVILGGVYASLQKGVGASEAAIAKNVEARQKTNTLVLEIATSFLPGAVSRIATKAGTAIFNSEAARQHLNTVLNNTFGKVEDHLKSRLKDAILEAAKTGNKTALNNVMTEIRNSSYQDSNPIDLLNDLYDVYRQSIPNGADGSINGYSNFIGSYSEITAASDTTPAP